MRIIGTDTQARGLETKNAHLAGNWEHTRAGGNPGTGRLMGPVAIHSGTRLRFSGSASTTQSWD